MRRRSFLSCGIAAWMALPGCGLVSGLDTLHVGDASADASVADASDDVADAAIVSADASVDGNGIHCGPQTCVGGLVCCINPTQVNTYTCVKDGCGVGVETLKCDDKSDCTSTSAPQCCFSNGSSQCALSSGSNNCVALCNDVSQCSGTSQCVPFDSGTGLPLMRCQ